jgi:hypothetical protein
LSDGDSWALYAFYAALVTATQEGPKKARLWPVELIHSWTNRFRRLLIRWKKLTDNFPAMLHAFAVICVQRAAWRQSG